MPINFSKMPTPGLGKRPVDPLELFRSVHITDPEVNDLWLGQGDALRAWHAERDKSDTVIVLNTGAGKTLVSLLIAQSIVNEKGGHVLYACTTNQLVQQTAAKAMGYGIDVTTYFSRSFNNDRYREGLSPCITNYQAIFNGKSRFMRDDIAAVIFDDAHAAEHIIRDQFTLSFSAQVFPAAYAEIYELFRGYFARIGMEISYRDTLARQGAGRDWLVPPFVVREKLGHLQEILWSANPEEHLETMFSWKYLKDRIDLCTIIVNAREICITPAFIPINNLPIFEKSVRRLYLSATLAADDSFLRTFGRKPELVIQPRTTAGECERLVILPARNPECESDIEAAKSIVGKKKALILVPSHRQAEEWKDVGRLVETAEVADALEKFKVSKRQEKLVLAARYDGVDLPGDTCRLLVLDDLPSSVGTLERFMWEWLGLGVTLRSAVACRIIQSFGRISRGLTDYGVVILTGRRLIDWILSPKNRSLLPVFLQRQIELGKLLAEGSSYNDLLDAADQCLSRDPGWVSYYEKTMKAIDPGPEQKADPKLLDVAAREVEFASKLWDREYIEAGKALERGLETTFEMSRNTGAWHSLWLGAAYEFLGDMTRAHELYRRAHAVAKNIPPFDLQEKIDDSKPVPQQVVEISRYLHNGPQIRTSIPGNFDTDLKYLDGTGSSNQTEEAVRVLGEFLGLTSTRPDSEFGTGPDVLWLTAGLPAFSMELKTGKTSGKTYGKKDIYQWNDHIQWVKKNSEATQIVSAFVGGLLPASPKANPSEEMIVILLTEFQKIAERLRLALKEICSKALPITLRAVIHEVLEREGLLWPALFDGLEKYRLIDIK